MRSIAASICACALLGAALLSACGSSEDEAEAEGTRDAALASLELTTEATSLEADMARLVTKLSDDPSDAERRRLEQRLADLEERAADLIASADAESTFDVELEPINGSGAKGTMTLVDAGGEVAIEGSMEGMTEGESHPLAIHALKRDAGSSVCPPADAVAGADDVLDASEAADFYGPPALDFDAVQADGVEVAISSAGKAGGAPPLTARTVVVSGGEAGKDYDEKLPIACGVPAVAPAEETATADAVAATEETRAAALDVSFVVANPTAKLAPAARKRAEQRLKDANGRLKDAIEQTEVELEGSGEVSEDESAELGRPSRSSRRPRRPSRPPSKTSRS